MPKLSRAAVAFVLLFAAGAAHAGQLDWNMRLTVQHAVASVADAEAGRHVGLIEVSGPAGIAGETAEVTVLVLYDYTEGTGPWQAYMTASFADGSVLTTSATGLTSADAQGLNSQFDGALVVIDGTGRFAGATGAGRMAGQRTPSVGDDAQIDYEITLRLDD